MPLEQVKSGQTVVITSRGKPIARLEPVPGVNLPPDLEALWRAGKVRWNGRPTRFSFTAEMTPGDSIVAKIVDERERV